MKNKGWIRLVEAFVAILLIAGVLVIIVDQINSIQKDPSQKIYQQEDFILKKITLNNTLRSEVLDPGLAVPIDSTSEEFPSYTKDIFEENIPGNLDCLMQICNINNECVSDVIEEEIKATYVRSSPVFANLTDYTPRQVKIFCQEK